MTIQSIKGFADLFSPQSLSYSLMESVAKDIFARYGYAELRTPIMEQTDLFCRSIGTETDVVQKEMYTFLDRKNRSITLRPEATAGVMRSFIQAKLSADSVHKFFTYGPMFRYERPQKGRMRQFHQLNCECLGSKEAHTDAEMIVMLMQFLEKLQIVDTELQINTLGCSQCRPQFRKQLSDFLHALGSDKFCSDCLRRIDTNPLRVLDCKVPTCKELTKDAPNITDNVCSECADHFDSVLSFLNASKQAFIINSRLVRGLDYYSRTTFEVVSGSVGAQSSIAGGGRYDGLVKQLGGPDVPGLGFACGMERLAMLMPSIEVKRPLFHIIHIGDKALDLAFSLCYSLRKQGFCGELSHSRASFKSQMRLASKYNARLALIIGEDEVNGGSVTVKDMDDGSQNAHKVHDLIDVITTFNSSIV